MACSLIYSFHFLDVPRLVIGSTGVPITNQSDAKNESGGYLLPSLRFPTEAIVEAWEVYAESPGRIQLQVRLHCFSPHELRLFLARSRNLIRPQSSHVSVFSKCWQWRFLFSNFSYQPPCHIKQLGELGQVLSKIVEPC